MSRLDDLQSERRDIAIETTLASRTLAPRIERLQREGYRFNLYFFWLPSPEMAIQRVALRVLSGGHDIPKPVIRRRYEAGLNNFFSLYQPLAHLWRVYDNTQPAEPSLVAKGTLRVPQAVLWEQIKKGYTIMETQTAAEPAPVDLDNDEEVGQALGAAVRNALREHNRRGQSVSFWQDGKVVTLAPEDIPIDLTDEAAPGLTCSAEMGL